MENGNTRALDGQFGGGIKRDSNESGILIREPL